MTKWNFPSNGGGQVRGIADSGMETFRDDRIRALAREICQNSLDAAASDSKCVEVEFEHGGVPKDEIPGYGDVKNVLLTAQKYWHSQNSEDAKAFLDRAVKAISGQTSLIVLRVGDYNTTGLANPFDYKRMDGWNSLTRLDGGATKQGDSAGSYGIGKNAPFVNSYFRLVFYRTLNEAHETAAQGMMRLLSFPKNGNPDEMTTGFGYYGNPDHNLPVSSIPELEQFNSRTRMGTDVFIYGFAPVTDGKGGTWIDDIKTEILSNFLISIFRNRLVVRFWSKDVNKMEQIDRSTISKYANKYKGRDKNMFNTCLLLSHLPSCAEFKKDFHGLGVLHLWLYTDDNQDLNRKVLVVRKSGMKLFLMDHLSRMANFTGILELEGKELNDYFRKMENPEHTQWEPNRHPNRSEARKYVRELRQWVQDQVIGLTEDAISNETEVKGLGGMLQENAVDIPSGKEMDAEKEQKGRETLRYEHPDIEITETAAPATHRGVLHSDGKNQQGNQPSKTEPQRGTITPDGKIPAVRTLHGTRKRKKKENHTGVPDEKGKDIVHKPVGGHPKDVPLMSVRMMKMPNGQYRLIFASPRDVKNGHIELVTVGENGRSVILPIQMADHAEHMQLLSARNGQIWFANLSSAGRVKVDFRLSVSKEYAMEVHVYEDH